MFKKKGAPKNIRKRDADSADLEDDRDDVALSSSSVTSENRTFESSNKKDSSSSRSLQTVVVFESDRSTTSAQVPDAFRTNEVDTEIDKDKQSILERNIQIRKSEQMDGGGAEGPKLYKGHSAYKSFTASDDPEHARNMKSKGTQGPVRAPSFVRSTAIFDYNPEVCKDYKETGFCGFGDSCLYMHDRHDYKSGWQQEKEWEELQAKKKKRIEEAAALSAFASSGECDFASGAVGDDADGMLALLAENLAEGSQRPERIDGHKAHDYRKGQPSQMQQISNVKMSSRAVAVADDEELPFACYLCRKSFSAPVVTTCGHYFCTVCIITANKKNPKCPVCKKPTLGVFNVAHKIIAKQNSA
jgi:RING finger protein 113A